MRYCSPVLLLRRRVRSGVPNPWVPAARSWYLVSIYDLMFLTREILQPLPDTLQACTIWCSEPVRSCSPVRIPCRHVRSCVPSPWDHATPSWHQILIWCFKPLRSWSPLLMPIRPCTICSFQPTWYIVGMYGLVLRVREIMQRRPDTYR